MVCKRTLVVLAVCLVAIVGLSLFTWSLLHPRIQPKYERNIARNVDNHEEDRALAAAESANYTTITSLQRFDGSSDPEAYLNPGTYLSYTSANFVDSEVLSYYQTRYDNQQGKEYPHHITFNYTAKVAKNSELRIYNSPAPEGATWHNITVVISTPNGTTMFNSGSMQFFYKNQTGYQMVEWDYDFNFSDCYIVEQNLLYSETYAPLAAFFASAHQIVVLDKSLEPVLVGLESGMAVA